MVYTEVMSVFLIWIGLVLWYAYLARRYEMPAKSSNDEIHAALKHILEDSRKVSANDRHFFMD
jgi:cytoskeletal protein RodZ